MTFIKSADLEQLQFAAVSFKKTQHFSLAEDAYRQLIELETSCFGAETSSVALNLYNLAEVLVHQQKYDEARNLLRRAVEIWERANPNDYMSLLSYTEAVSSVKRYAARTASATATTAVIDGSTVATLPAQSPAIGGVTLTTNVIPMRRGGAVHVA